MILKNCCSQNLEKEKTKNLKKNISLVHEFEDETSVFRWERCELCGGIYLEKIELNTEGDKC